MRRILLATLCSTIVLGCATSTEIRHGAYDHLAKAQAYETHGDYYRAAEERAKADKQFLKASQRAADEAYLGIYRF